MKNCEHKWVDYTDRNGKTESLCLYCPLSKAEHDASKAATDVDSLIYSESPFLSTVRKDNLLKLGNYGLLALHGGKTPVSMFLDASKRTDRVSDWLPSIGPGPHDNFHGVNRSVDRSGRAGYRYAALKSSPVEETVLNLVALILREGGRCELIVCQSSTFNELIIALGSTAQTTLSVGSKTALGIPALAYLTPYGRICIIADDQTGEPGAIYGITVDTWAYDDKFGLYCTDPSANGVAVIS